MSLETLRTRARDLARNNPYSKRAIEVIANNTVGTGIRPSHRGLTENQIKRLKAVWSQWAETTLCDYSGQMDIYAMQRQVMAAVARDGECLIVRKVNTDKNAVVPFQLMILEADYLSTDVYPNFQIDKGNYIIQGVEFNKAGKRVAYWLYDQHPGDMMRPYSNLAPKRTPADMVAHVYIVDRPGQVRGIPFGVSGMVKIRDFEEYQDAELVRRKVASLMVAFVGDSVGSSIGSQNAKSKFPTTMKPGSILETKPGQTVTMSTPPSVDGYAEYSRVVLQSIASAYGITYEALTGNLGDVNFSSGRMGWLEFHRNVQDWQYNLIVPMFLDRVYEWFKEGLSITGAAKAPTHAIWTAPRREMIDPVKEVKGMNDLIRSGLGSRSDAIRMLGSEPDEVLAEMIADAKELDKSGLMFDSDPRFDATRNTDVSGDTAQKPSVVPPKK
jgi:lambda family phage portal protein